MLNLFVKAFGVISDSKFDLQKNNTSSNLDFILKQLSELQNSIDKNENRVFTKSMIETRIFALYNRIVGYRNSTRSIAMLQSVMDLIINKMLAMRKVKTSTLNISEPTRQAPNLSGHEPNPMYAAKI